MSLALRNPARSGSRLSTTGKKSKIGANGLPPPSRAYKRRSAISDSKIHEKQILQSKLDLPNRRPVRAVPYASTELEYRHLGAVAA